MLIIDKQSNVPIYEQIIKQYKKMIMQDVLTADELLPSVRKLSCQLSINPNTLQKAYSELENLGICYSVAGKGRFVSKNAKELIKKDKAKIISDFKENVYNLALFGVEYQELIDVIKSEYDKVTIIFEK